MRTTKVAKMTTKTEAEAMGAPSQDEIATYQQASADAQMAGIKANAKVAECQEALALAQAELAATNTAVARLNVVGAELQQRVQFSREASAATPSRLHTAGQLVRR